MFTGLIQQLGKIQSRVPGAAGLQLVIEHNYPALVLGESIAVNGTCLTVTQFSGHTFHCDISPETCRLTTLGELEVGDVVNLERALTMGDHLGGHMVSGHVDQVAHVVMSDVNTPFLSLKIGRFDMSSTRYLVMKGSIAVNGVSLTINEVDTNEMGSTIALTLVPHTQAATTLGQIKVGDAVNIEFDMIAKMVAHQAAPYLNLEESLDA